MTMYTLCYNTIHYIIFAELAGAGLDVEAAGLLAERMQLKVRSCIT